MTRKPILIKQLMVKITRTRVKIVSRVVLTDPRSVRLETVTLAPWKEKLRPPLQVTHYIAYRIRASVLYSRETRLRHVGPVERKSVLWQDVSFRPPRN